MTFNAFIKELFERTGLAYGAGPVAFRRLMKRLGNPQNCYKIIHVAGTNGKGSICYLCAEILKSAGYKTGLFISPHLHGVTERIQLNGEKIPRADFVRLCKQVLAAEEEKLNFFEILTAAAFLCFAEKKAQWVVLETGLGGGKDPTNICKPAASVISSVGLDHCHILGNTPAQIAREKAGIIKRTVPVFCPPLAREAMRQISQAAMQKQAPLHVIKQGQPFKLAKIDWKKSEMILRKGPQTWPLHLLGEKQVQNACLIYQLCRELNIPEKTIQKGFANVQIPARFEIIEGKKNTVILDGAHNPQAIESLIKLIKKSPWKHKIIVVCGFMADKDYPTMLRMLSKNATAVYLTTPGGPRAVTPAQLKTALPYGVSAQCFKYPMQALNAALQGQEPILITGSFYLVAYVRSRLLALARRKKD